MCSFVSRHERVAPTEHFHFHKVDQAYRESQLKINQTEVYRRYFDYITTIDISHEAPYHQRNRYGNTITMSRNDPNFQSGPMRMMDDYRAATRALVMLREEQGRTNTSIPKKERTKQRNSRDPTVQEYLTWLSVNCRTHFATTESSSSASSTWNLSWWSTDKWNH